VRKEPYPDAPIMSGDFYSIYIDDSGSGRREEAVRLVAVVFAPEFAPLVPVTMARLLAALSVSTGAREFHFTDVFQGKGEFSGVSIQQRLDIFRTFAEAVAALQPSIFVQSIDDATLKAVLSTVNMPSLPVPLTPQTPQGFAMIGLLIRASEHIRRTRSGAQLAVALCDHGILKSGTGVHLPFWPDVIYKNTIYFIDSTIEVGIQIADFAAFLLNRHQQILQRGTPTDFEKSFLNATVSVLTFFRNVEAQTVRGPLNPKYHKP
jgi:hypothetical protein